MTAPEHTMSAIYGLEGAKYGRCSCGVRVEGPTNEAVRFAHEAHVGELAAQPGLARARRALADSVRKGKPHV